MSNAITEARAEVAAVVRELGIPAMKVYDYLPKTIAAPTAIVFPNGDYLTPGQAFGDWNVSLKVRIFLERGTNEVLTKTLDGLIVEVASALHKEFGGVSVTAPFIDDVSVEGTNFYTVDITIATLNYKGDS